MTGLLNPMLAAIAVSPPAFAGCGRSWETAEGDPRCGGHVVVTGAADMRPGGNGPTAPTR